VSAELFCLNKIPLVSGVSTFLMSSLFRQLLCLIALVSLSWAGPSNLAPGGTSNGSSQAHGSTFKDANDGNRDGNFFSSAGSVWHTNSPDLTAFYEVDLGGDFYLDRVMIWPRTDAVQGTVENFTIQVLNATNDLVWTADYWTTEPVSWAWGSSAMRAGAQSSLSEKGHLPEFPHIC
jgi:hypothetical protein